MSQSIKSQITSQVLKDTDSKNVGHYINDGQKLANDTFKDIKKSQNLLKTLEQQPPHNKEYDVHRSMCYMNKNIIDCGLDTEHNCTWQNGICQTYTKKNCYGGGHSFGPIALGFNISQCCTDKVEHCGRPPFYNQCCTYT